VTVLNAEEQAGEADRGCRDLIQKKIDVLIINATHDGAAAVLNKAADAGIPVITLQRGVPGAKVVSISGPTTWSSGARGPSGSPRS